MPIIYHITRKQDWNRALATGSYTADSLATEGFIHCSLPTQVTHVADWFYRDIPDLVLLCIDADGLTSELLWEASSDAFAGEFPHVYGPISVGAVRAVVPWARGDDGFEVPIEVRTLEEL